MEDKQSEEYSLGELLHINWNRMAELSGINNKRDFQRRELRCRTSIQNIFSCGGKDKDVRELILWLNDKTKINVKKYIKKNMEVKND